MTTNNHNANNYVNIGSGGNYALSAAMAMMDREDLEAEVRYVWSVRESVYVCLLPEIKGVRVLWCVYVCVLPKIKGLRVLLFVYMC